MRREKYDLLINLHRFASSGFIAFRSKAKTVIGFSGTPFSRFYTHSVKHEIGNGKHETERNFELLKTIMSTDISLQPPKLYPRKSDYEAIKPYCVAPYFVVAPASVWFTKQLPRSKWIELIRSKPGKAIYLIGATGDRPLLDGIASESGHTKVRVLAGELSLLASAALISSAERTYVNDSAPLHIASAMNAPVTVFFCSTIPAFGFGPLSSDSRIVEVSEELSCRPCGLHGYRKCPAGHFKCGNDIDISES